MRRFALFMVILFFGSICQAANIYVNHTGSNTSPYETEAKATRNIQTALSAATTNDDVVWIKADQDYVMNGTDQQASAFSWGTGNRIRVKGYYLTTGDQDYGGTYYKDPDHGWVVVDANSGNFHVFYSNTTNIMEKIWENIKITNVASNKTGFFFGYTSAKPYFIFRNCWITGGAYGMYLDNMYDVFIEDCKFTGTYVTDALYLGTSVTRVHIFGCEFAHGNASRSIRFNASMTTGCVVIIGNTFNISGTVDACIWISGASWISNNTIYGSAGTVTYGIYSYNVRNDVIQNNIIVGCTTGEGGFPWTLGYIGGWNCFYNNGENWTIRERSANDIVADPQFMDAANGDFRLKPTSPCLNTGKPTLGGGKTTIGAWQPAICESVPSGDLNNDFRVDFYDFAKMASNWLIDCTTDPNDPACVPE